MFREQILWRSGVSRQFGADVVSPKSPEQLKSIRTQDPGVKACDEDIALATVSNSPARPN